jgi:hypothetical protein
MGGRAETEVSAQAATLRRGRSGTVARRLPTISGADRRDAKARSEYVVEKLSRKYPS